MSSKKPAVAVPAVVLDPSQTAFNTRQAAVYLGLTCWQVRSAIWSGKLPAKRVGRDLIIRRVDADAFLSGLPNAEPITKDWMLKRLAKSAQVVAA
jgi:excisionase family DNA binding protein